MLNVAFKEWAAVCRALAEGRQTLILRKGGIAEDGGEFRPEHPRFWLYPTYFHEQAAALVPEAAPLIATAEAERPPSGRLLLTHFAEVEEVHRLESLDAALALDGLHVWTGDTVRQRFHYRNHGLFVLVVRVYGVDAPVDLPEHPPYAGCKTWVELADPAEELPATPALADGPFAGLRAEIARRLAGD